MPATTAPAILVSTDWLAANLGDPQVRLFDCSVDVTIEDGKLRYGSGTGLYAAQHIPGAAFADLTSGLNLHDEEHHWFTLPAPDAFASAAGALGIGDGLTVVLYDQGQTAWAARLWWQLRVNGFAAYVLDGGFTKWQAEGRPVAVEPTCHPAATLTPHPRPELIARQSDVAAASAAAGSDAAACLINTVGPEQHRGSAPIHVGRPGHIPGSGNVPYAALLDPATNAYLPAEQLRSIFAAELGATAAAGGRPVITYCNAGIAATSAALALAVAGVEQVAVYDGSLHEWAADPSLPLVVSP